MKVFKTSKGEFCAVNVPKESYSYSNLLASNQLDYLEDIIWINSPLKTQSSKLLPKGNWQIIAPLKDVTELQAKEVVDKTYDNPVLYYNYTIGTAKSTALESLHSKMKELGFNPNDNIILLKKI